MHHQQVWPFTFPCYTANSAVSAWIIVYYVGSRACSFQTMSADFLQDATSNVTQAPSGQRYWFLPSFWAFLLSLRTAFDTSQMSDFRPPSKSSILSADAKRKSGFPALTLDNAGLCHSLLHSLWHLTMLSISRLRVQSVSSGESNPRQVLTLPSLFFLATLTPMAHQPANTEPMWATNSVRLL